MLARTALRSTRIASPAAPRLARTYAEQAAPRGEPVNRERGQSRMPVYFAGALVLLVGGYFVGGFNTPPTPAVKAMQEAMHPKTPEAKLAAGIRNDPHDEPTKAGGDLKGRQPPK
ncbi:hypothetical protein Rhopal_007867-T1 [Rhodotorula paludigena]|uniref:Uncharacterized protein n=1 Tax=Rhodotorula paludigena TaxID=86838 RepID=A0AAV5GQC8_9BASI|nr:hypothetical protein Rhopal_007867-T1 [Rhodotorula paludigena]